MGHRPNNVECKAIQLLEDSIGENIDDLGFSNEFLDTTPKAQPKKKTDTVDFTKNLCSAKDKENEKTSHRVR